jgi:hypothetical protein
MSDRYMLRISKVPIAANGHCPTWPDTGVELTDATGGFEVIHLAHRSCASRSLQPRRK